jgi:hypothetical protein
MLGSRFFIIHFNAISMRLSLSAGATLTAHTAPAGVGKVIEETGNNKGVWVVGNARNAGSFSATVQLFTTIAAADFSGACVYGSNYPPVGKYTSATTIAFTGTPPYNLVLNEGSTFTVSYTLYVRASAGCSATRDNAALIAVINSPAMPAVTASAATVCQGTNVVFTATGGGTGATYSWTGNPTGTVSGTGNCSYTVSGTATGVKSVTAIAANAACSGTRSSTVTAYVAPTTCTTVVAF